MEIELRFVTNGPVVPSELLTLRDQGEVVFFCGAGISIPAGLPSFFELTKRMMDRLGVSPTSKVGALMARAIAENDPEFAPPLDQVFRMLQQEYTAGRVEREVTSFLKTPKRADISKHDIVLRLSSDASGSPFIVTTNFDLLFERAQRGLKLWVPPMLPGMTGDQLHSGVVYLHGRLPTNSKSSSDPSTLVLGSGDFGRAYLADGWATTFIRQLLERRVVVLLGYSAGDPPIRYLLEGLEASTSARLRTIYAFDRGEESEVRAKWRDIGVRGIAFSQFDDLWQSLEKWAIRADDRDTWKTEMLSLGQMSPRELLPFQRGQVASFVETTEGAKAFADAKSPPTSEWLCVFDKYTRYSSPSKGGWDDDAIELDPLKEYGLDDDPARPNDTLARIEGIDLWGSLLTDVSDPNYSRLSGIPGNRRGGLPPRLWSLSRWFERVAHEPAAIWWAARQSFLHPELMWGINRRLTGYGEKFDDQTRKTWSLLYEVNSNRVDDIHDRDWYDFERRLRQDGWTPGMFRFFEETIRPRLAIEAPAIRSPLPPISREEIDPRKLIRLKVHVPSRHDSKVQIPDEVIAPVFRVMRRSLERAISSLEESNPYYFHLPAIKPDARPGERFVRNDGVAALFLWAVKVFEKYLELSPSDAKQEVFAWPQNDRFFFDKFRLFVWNSDVFDGQEVGIGIIRLNPDSFWNPYLQRELLHLLKARWNDFLLEKRMAIEDRIIAGRDKYETETAEQFEERNTDLVASRLGWLDRNGCALSKRAADVLAGCRAKPDWKAVWEKNADRDMDGRTGWVERRKDASDLTNVPLAEILTRAAVVSGRDREAFVEYAPFEGLVREKPHQALSALTLEMRKGSFPTRFWEQLLSDWPDTASERLTVLCGWRAAGLPTGTIFDLRFYLPGWIEKKLAKKSSNRLSSFFAIWDLVFEKLEASGDEATKSAIGEVSVGRRVLERSRKTLDYAINAPVGNLVDALFETLGDKTFSKSEGLPAELTRRLERALSAPGEGAYHAASLLGRRLTWLFFVDPEWTRTVIVPTFDLKAALAEAAWNGFLFQGQVPESAELFNLIKANFLSLIETRQSWLDDDQLERQTAQFLIVATYWKKHDDRYLANTESRRALQSMSESGRESALWMVNQIVGEQNAWSSFGKQFFAEIWPQEARFQTSGTTETMIRIAEDRPDRFPEIVQTIVEYLRPIEHPDLFIFRQRRETGTENERAPLVELWPMQVLEVADRVIAKEPTNVPYDLNALLDDIAEHAPVARTSKSWRRLHELVSK